MPNAYNTTSFTECNFKQDGKVTIHLLLAMVVFHVLQVIILLLEVGRFVIVLIGYLHSAPIQNSGLEINKNRG